MENVICNYDYYLVPKGTKGVILEYYDHYGRYNDRAVLILYESFNVPLLFFDFDSFSYI